MKFDEIINKFESKRILLVGDLMLDRETIGEITRISPEAPVQVVEVKEERFILGGAGNVANNLRSLGARVFVVGVVGNDEAGKQLISKFKNERINVDGIKIVNDRPTTQKNRIICKNQQLIRTDYEKRGDIDEKTENEILNYIRSIIKKVDGVVISDYAKGVLTENISKEIIKISNESKTPVVVDPKPDNINKFKGATLLTPNLKEAKEITNLEDLDEIGKKIAKEFNSNVLITRGKEGMSLFVDNNNMDIKTNAKEVYDVTGAGDTVISALILSLVSGANLEDSCRIASNAAGIVVGKFGTDVVFREELLNKGKESVSKIKNIEELKGLVYNLKRKDKKIVFTNGAFDLLHAGHIKTLKKARTFGDVLIVGLNDDAYIRRHKGEYRPVFNEKERAEMLSALDCVDYLTIFREDTVIKLLNEIKPDVHVKGGSYVEWRVKEEKELVESYGGEIKFLEMVKDLSSSSTIDRILGKAKK